MNSCPVCLSRLDPDRIAYACEHCDPVEDEAASAHLGMKVSARPVTVVDGRQRRKPASDGSVTCDRCKQAATLRVCSHCHQPLPVDWDKVRTTCVVMAGPTTSGKSIYVAVLVRQLMLLAQQMGIGFDYFDKIDEDTYVEQYERPLFTDRKVFQATTPVGGPGAAFRPPATIRIRLGRAQGRPHVLVLRDIAGENLQRPDLAPGIFGLLDRADGIIFLFDPLKVEAIREMLAGVVAETRLLGAEAVAVLKNVTKRLSRSADTNLVRVPTAVAVSKFDTIHQLEGVEDHGWRQIMQNVGSAMHRDPALRPTFDDDDSRLLNLEMEALLEELGGLSVLNHLQENYADHRLFAVSALGHQPPGESLLSQGVAPFRVLDPLKWFLNRAGVLAREPRAW